MKRENGRENSCLFVSCFVLLSLVFLRFVFCISFIFLEKTYSNKACCHVIELYSRHFWLAYRVAFANRPLSTYQNSSWQWGLEDTNNGNWMTMFIHFFCLCTVGLTLIYRRWPIQYIFFCLWWLKLHMVCNDFLKGNLGMPGDCEFSFAALRGWFAKPTCKIEVQVVNTIFMRLISTTAVYKEKNRWWLKESLKHTVYHALRMKNGMFNFCIY